jgi:cardiolipin synthase
MRFKQPSPLQTAQKRAGGSRKGLPKGRPGWLGSGRKLFWSWWLWIVAAIALEMLDHWGAGVACATIGFVFYLLTPQEHVPRYGLEGELAVHSHEFLTSIVGTTGVPFVKDNKITILNNGDQFYPAMLEAIGDAAKTITMEAYIFWKGDIGHRFAEALAARRRAGVTVKLLLDAVGSASIGTEIQQILEDSGCELVWYNPIRLRTISRFNNRTHRKSLIVDGRIAFTGGAGIADHWTGNGQDPAHWRDIQIRLEGPGAFGLQTGFAQNWLDTTGELVSGEGFFPPCDAAGTMAAQTILSTPEAGSSAVRIMYYLSIVSARHSIYIANPYFIPDDAALEILIEARRRGVDVKLMIAGIHNDMRVSRYSGIHLYGKLLEAGIEIYEYNRTMLHQKTMVVDGIWSTVGTTNFDNRSFALNEESNVCVHDRRLAGQLEQIFMEDLKGCDRVTLEKWRRRGLKTRLLGAVCLFLKDQM